MNLDFEASPYINTIANEKARKELYANYFDVPLIGNIKGAKPVKGYGFWESDEAFSDRLKEWEQNELNVLFDGWVCKDMKHFQVFTREYDDTVLTFEFSSYTVAVAGKQFLFPLLPDTIDDLITDLKRVGVKMFWKPEVLKKFTPEAVTSSKKVVEYYRIIRDMS